MARGNEAKANLIKRFIAAVGSDYAGSVGDKDYYFWSIENGERIQIKINMTCPKVPMEFEGNGGDINFEDDRPATTPQNDVTKMDSDEKETLDRLMKELGL